MKHHCQIRLHYSKTTLCDNSHLLISHPALQSIAYNRLVCLNMVCRARCAARSEQVCVMPVGVKGGTFAREVRQVVSKGLGI